MELITGFHSLTYLCDSLNGGLLYLNIMSLGFLFLKLLPKPFLSIYGFDIVKVQGFFCHP